MQFYHSFFKLLTFCRFCKGYVNLWVYVGSMVAQRAALPHLKAPEFNSELRFLFVQSFSYSTCVHVGFLWVVQFPPSVQKHAVRWSDCARLPLVVNDVWICAYVWCTMMDWCPLLGEFFHRAPSVARSDPRSTATLVKILTEDERMINNHFTSLHF